MSTSDLLRRAESLLREYATVSEERHLHPGRWWAGISGDGDGAVHSPLGVVSLDLWPDEARFIALLDPPVAHLLADVMGHAAGVVEEWGESSEPSTLTRLVDLARAILREDFDG